MPGSPYTLGIRILDTDGSTRLANVNVRIRNESTNETAAANTNAAGEAVFQLANKNIFESGWTVGDLVSFGAFYQTSEVKSSITLVDEGGTTQILTLVAISDAPSLRYFTPQEWLDCFGLVSFEIDPKSGIKPETIVKVGESIETHIDEITYRRWDSNDGDFTTVTQELHNSTGDASIWPYDIPNISGQRLYFTRKGPINTLTTFEVNKAGPNQSTNFVTLTEAANEITVRLDQGRIEIVDVSDLPAAGKDQVRITYNYGETNVPADIKRLAILMTARGFAGQSLQALNIKRTEAEGLSSAIQNISNADMEIKNILQNRTFHIVRAT